MEWPATVDLAIERMAQGGEGVGRWQGRVVFASGGLPGEQVRVALHTLNQSYARGEVIEIQQPAPERLPVREPGAPHMPWQHVQHAAQLGYKQTILHEQLTKIGDLESVQVETTIAAVPPWGYRSTARLHSDGRSVGYLLDDGETIMPIRHDPLLKPALNDALAALQDVLDQFPLSGPFEVNLRLSESEGYVLATLDGRQRMRMLATRWRVRCPELAGVAFNSRPALVLGAEQLVEEIAGLTFVLRPTTFFQVSVRAAETLLELVRAGLGDTSQQRLLDLYCGAGTFTLPLARQAVEVVGIEQWEGAVADAEHACTLNGITNVRMLAGSVEKQLATLQPGWDAVVLDPPRRGCHPAAIQELIRLAPARIVYVSCQPATLARDLKLLVAGGYQVERVTPVDLFPQTPHIESVTVLVKG